MDGDRSRDESGAAIAEMRGDPAIDDVLTSWRRSAEEYRVDRESNRAPTFLTDSELRYEREAIERLVEGAQGELDQLYSIVRRASYTVLLANIAGIGVDHRNELSEYDQHRRAGTWLGSVWSEPLEGTNGIGTSLVEQRSVLVHQDQHFRVRHARTSCAATPIFDHEGKLLGVLDITSIDPTLSDQSHALTLPLIESSAQAIEERLFRENFRNAWVLAMAASEERPMLLLAVDRDQRIIGADRHTRSALRLSDEALRAGLSLGTLFTHDRAPFRRQDGSDSLVQLKHVGSDEVLPAIVSAPSALPGASLSAIEASLRLRSRRGLVAEVHRHAMAAPSRGGLTAGVLRRVSRYVEERMHENITLEALAAEANLSVYHFAREFKRAVGVPPHRFLLERRVARARELLAHGDSSVAEVARLVGFADQSHFARHFGRLTGWTPSAFRRAQR